MNVLDRQLALNRRDWLLRAGLLGSVSASGWLGALASETEDNPKRKKSVIMLWLTGGPATIDLWDLKPKHQNGGPFRPIDTATPGIQISEHLSKLAYWTDEMAILRSMSTREGDHTRAMHLLRTGYKPQGAIRFPAFGAVMAHERDTGSTDLPRFISIAPSSRLSEVGSGFLGPRYAPLSVGDSGAGDDDLTVPNLSRPEEVSTKTQADRLKLLHGLEREFVAGQTSPVSRSLRSSTERAVRLMRPEAASAFKLEEEPEPLRSQYGGSTFGQGCLLARRLVERGVPFVEVSLNGWDTHRNNFEQVEGLSKRLDSGFAALLKDLKSRGLLESTLVICQGEFGRTPRINGNSGRDHWPASWATVLAGGGIRGGQTVGQTSPDGTEVTERPLSVPDLIATVCKIVDIDPMKQNLSNVSRPIRIANPEAQPIG